MQYKTELHAHTSDVSRCAKMLPEEVAEQYIAAGYSTLVLTNHYAEYIFDGKGSWEERIAFYLSAVHRMREYAKDRLTVLCGAEVRNYHTSNDYLLYGAEEEFFIQNRNLHRLFLKELSALARKNDLLLVHAHPFRNNMTVADPKLIDGIEVFNGTPHTESRNHFANMWAKQYGLLRTSGSDFHGGRYIIAGGIKTDFPIQTSKQLKETLKSGNYTLICEGPSAERDGMTDMPAKD